MDKIPDFIRSEKLDVSSIASDNDLANARDMCMSYIDLNHSIEEMEENLKELKKQKIVMEMREIPDIFMQIGTDKLGIAEANVDIIIKPYYKASISSEWEQAKQNAAFQWLEDNGHGSVIKTTVSVEFGKSELEKAQELKKFIEENFSALKQHPVNINMSVHWATLTSLVKELANQEHENEDGESIPIEERIPLETLGATVGKIAIIKERK